MRIVVLCFVASLVFSSCKKSDSSPSIDAATPEQNVATITIDDKPFVISKTTAVQLNRAGENDPRRASVVSIKFESASGEMLLVEIPWKEGLVGDRDGVLVSYATKTATLLSNANTTHANLKKVEPSSSQTFLCDAEFDTTVTKVMSSESAAIKASITGLSVKSMPKLLEHRTH